MYPKCTRNAYHLYMFRYNSAHFSGLSRDKFLKALRAEGVPASSGYSPLNKEPLLKNTLESRGFKRIYGGDDLHFITSSCYQRLPLLATRARRNTFLLVLEQVRKYYRFRILGYVVMPEHFHLLMSEPGRGDPSRVMHALKRRVARRLLAGKREFRAAAQQPLWPPELKPHFWQHRFYDFNVYSKKKRIEKLRYMHRNPVTRKLAVSPDQWAGSSYRYYYFGESGIVKVEPAAGI